MKHTTEYIEFDKWIKKDFLFPTYVIQPSCLESNYGNEKPNMYLVQKVNRYWKYALVDSDTMRVNNNSEFKGSYLRLKDAQRRVENLFTPTKGNHNEYKQ